MFLPNRRSQPSSSSRQQPELEPSASSSPSSASREHREPPPEAPSALTSARAPLDRAEPVPPPADQTKRAKLRQSARTVTRPSTWFGWAPAGPSDEAGPSSQPAHPSTGSPVPTSHRRESSDPEPRATTEKSTPSAVIGAGTMAAPGLDRVPPPSSVTPDARSQGSQLLYAHSDVLNRPGDVY